MVVVEVIVTDIQVTEGPGTPQGVIEVHQEEHLLDTEAEEAELLYHAAPVTAADTIVVAVAPSGVVVPFGAVVGLQWRWLDHVPLLGLRGEDLLLEAGAHQNQGPLQTPSLQFERGKPGLDHHRREAQTERRAWFLMVTVPRTRVER